MARSPVNEGKEEVAAARIGFIDKELSEVERARQGPLSLEDDLVWTTKRAELLHEKVYLSQAGQLAGGHKALADFAKDPDFRKSAREVVDNLVKARGITRNPLAGGAGVSAFWCSSCTMGACPNCVHCVPNGILKANSAGANLPDLPEGKTMPGVPGRVRS